MPALVLVTYAGICSHAQAGNASIELSGVVSVPVLVETKSGELAYDFSGSDFLIKDNGLKQRTTLNGAVERKPLSLVLVIQTGHGGAAKLQTTTHVNGLLDTALAGPDDQIAIIGFDGRPKVLQQFTSDSGEITSTLVSIAAGDSGAALFDGMHLALGDDIKMDAMPYHFEQSSIARLNPSSGKRALLRPIVTVDTSDPLLETFGQQMVRDSYGVGDDRQ